MAYASIDAGARGTLIDVFLTAKARKSHLTNTARKEKIINIDILPQMENRRRFLQARAQSEVINRKLLILIACHI